MQVWIACRGVCGGTGEYCMDGVEGVVPVSARVCDFDPRKTCLAELGRVGKRASVGERVSRGN